MFDLYAPKIKKTSLKCFLKSLANSVGFQMQNKCMTVHTLCGWICSWHRTVFERSDVVRQTSGGISLNESLYPRRSALLKWRTVRMVYQYGMLKMLMFTFLNQWFLLITNTIKCKKNFFEGSKNMFVPIQWFMVKRIPQIYCFTNVKAEVFLV